MGDLPGSGFRNRVSETKSRGKNLGSCVVAAARWFVVFIVVIATVHLLQSVFPSFQPRIEILIDLCVSGIGVERHKACVGRHQKVCVGAHKACVGRHRPVNSGLN
ncbi:unnamed protein product [Microthlaspi erraticum]|uniref:Uncharacterized protein n=1 Tax=Microthlaspi erraticum TaxID=1685480 RepID=A0A6D2J9V0_9BRAS|nr:unnamed protein product [Microthlaspi erraticum]